MAINTMRSKSLIQTTTVVILPVVVIGVALLLLMNADSSSPLIFFPALILELPGIYLHTWLLGDPFAKLLSLSEAAIISKQVVWLSLLFWLIFSFAFVYFIKDKKYMIGTWIIVLVGCAIWAILFG